jgi:hypothetical protein
MEKTADEDDLRPHYDLDYSKMKPNGFARVKKVYKESFVTDHRADSKAPRSKPQEDLSD